MEKEHHHHHQKKAQAFRKHEIFRLIELDFLHLGRRQTFRYVTWQYFPFIFQLERSEDLMEPEESCLTSRVDNRMSDSRLFEQLCRGLWASWICFYALVKYSI